MRSCFREDPLWDESWGPCISTLHIYLYRLSIFEVQDRVIYPNRGSADQNITEQKYGYFWQNSGEFWWPPEFPPEVEQR